MTARKGWVSSLFAPAHCVPTDGQYYSWVGGKFAYTKETNAPLRYGETTATNIDELSPVALQSLATRGLGLSFRLERAPNVYKCEIVKVKVTILGIDPLPELGPKEAGVLIEPFVWVVQLPDGVQVGDTIAASLVQTFPDFSGARIVHSIPSLPVGASQPCIIRFTAKKPALYRIRTEVIVDAGWRSYLAGPIKICDGVGVPIYDESNVANGANPSQQDGAAPAEDAPEGEAAPAPPPAPETT